MCCSTFHKLQCCLGALMSQSNVLRLDTCDHDGRMATLRQTQRSAYKRGAEGWTRTKQIVPSKAGLQRPLQTGNRAKRELILGVSVTINPTHLVIKERGVVFVEVAAGVQVHAAHQQRQRLPTLASHNTRGYPA